LHNPCTYSDAAKRSRKTVWGVDLQLFSSIAEVFGASAPDDNLPRTCPPSTDDLLGCSTDDSIASVVLLWCCLVDHHACRFLPLSHWCLYRMHLLTHAFFASVASQRRKRFQLHIQLVSSPREQRPQFVPRFSSSPHSASQHGWTREKGCPCAPGRALREIGGGQVRGAYLYD
jgi:hypothetical protein